MVRISKCKNFLEIEKITRSLCGNVVVAFDFDGVLMKNVWDSPLLNRFQDSRKISESSIKKHQRLAEELKKEAAKYQISNGQSGLAGIVPDLEKICHASIQINYKLQEAYHKFANFVNNQVILADPSIPETLYKLNRNNIPFFCLTANYDACSLVRLNQFDLLKLTAYFRKPFLLKGASTSESAYFLRTDFNTVFTSKIIRREIPVGTPENAPCVYHGGNQISPVVFSKNPEIYYTYFSKNCTSLSKGDVLEQLIADGVFPYRLEHLVLVDDMRKNLEKFGNACRKLGINFWGIHFSNDENWLL
jgi:hypothetical protein